MVVNAATAESVEEALYASMNAENLNVFSATAHRFVITRVYGAIAGNAGAARRNINEIMSYICSACNLGNSARDVVFILIFYDLMYANFSPSISVCHAHISSTRHISYTY